MKTVYHVRVRSLEPAAPAATIYHYPASNVHYAVREVVFLAGKRGELPRGWKRLNIEVTR